MGWVTYVSDQLRADHIVGWRAIIGFTISGCFEIAQHGLHFETRDERSYALTVTLAEVKKLLSVYLSMNNLDGYGFKINFRRSASLAVLRTSGPTKLTNITLTLGEHVGCSSFRISIWLVSLAICLYRDHESSKIIHPLLSCLLRLLAGSVWSYGDVFHFVVAD